MATDIGSLLSLDSMTGEQATRFAVYAKASELVTKLQSSPPLEATADELLDFVSGSAWRLSVLDMAIEITGRRGTVKDCIDHAQRIANWVQPPVNIPVVREPAKKKASAKKF